MATDIANVPGRTLDHLERLKARSASFMAPGWTYDFYGFDTSVVATPWSVAGTWAAHATKGPGVWTAISLAAQVIFKTSCYVANPAATRWHIAVRMANTAAIVAGDIKGFGLTPFGDGVANTCHVGVRQATSATKYVFTSLKATVAVTALSTVSYDTNNFHEHEAWFDLTSMWGAVDQESPVLVTEAANIQTQASMQRCGIEAGTGSGVENLFDYVYIAADRTAT